MKEEKTIMRMEAGDPGFPCVFDHFANMPKELFYLGNLPDPEKKTVAVVGARVCTAYGRIQAFRFAKELSQNGVQVISGLACGIDAEAHKGALEGETPTFAVLGNGVDICYPAANRQIYERILRCGGGIISEYPPGSPPLPYHFPIRNRIISAWADLVLVVEARAKSGSLITAGYALDQGKPVYALPGAVHEKLSEGTNQLIFDGAGLALSPEVLLSELGLSSENKEKQSAKKSADTKTDSLLSTNDERVLSCISTTPVSAEEILLQTGMKYTELTETIIRLLLEGRIREISKGCYTVDYQ